MCQAETGLSLNFLALSGRPIIYREVDAARGLFIHSKPCLPTLRTSAVGGTPKRQLSRRNSVQETCIHGVLAQRTLLT